MPMSDAKQKPKPLSITELNRRIKMRLNRDFNGLWVRGEVSGLVDARSGHLYFNLKDDDAQIKAMIWESNRWRINCEIKDGMDLLCFGMVDVYSPRGTYQLSVRQANQVGLGAKQQALEALKTKLQKLGWFDRELKRPLPRFPKSVAVVTSPKGAAIHDFLQVIRRRWPYIEVVVVPTPVQGEVGPLIANAIRKASKMQPAVDVVVVTRGGGSTEDLWCFNDEQVCKAIYDCPIPVITGVGHEIDTCLCDYVSDVRALTPSEAAEKLVPDEAALQNILQQMGSRLSQSLFNRLEQAESRLRLLANRSSILRPLDQLREHSMRLDQINVRLQSEVQNQFLSSENRVAQLAGKLESLSPLSTLARGYSLTTREGQTLRDTSSLTVGDQVETKLHSGKLISRIEEIKKNGEEEK